jgi:hypothetical protein
VDRYFLALHSKLELGQIFSGITLETGAWTAILWHYSRNCRVEIYSMALHLKLERGNLFSGLTLETGAWKIFSGLTLETGACIAILCPYTQNWSVDSYSLVLHSKLERGLLFSGLTLETGEWKTILCP